MPIKIQGFVLCRVFGKIGNTLNLDFIGKVLKVENGLLFPLLMCGGLLLSPCQAFPWQRFNGFRIIDFIRKELLSFLISFFFTPRIYFLGINS